MEESAELVGVFQRREGGAEGCDALEVFFACYVVSGTLKKDVLFRVWGACA